MKRLIFILSFILFAGVEVQAQITLPAYQGVQAHVKWVYHPDALRFFSALESEGDTLSLTQKHIVDTLVRDLHGFPNASYATANIWPKCAAIYPIVGGKSSTHKWNLKTPTDDDAGFRIIFYGSPGHDASGIHTDGSTQYIDTRYQVPGTMPESFCYIYDLTPIATQQSIVGSYIFAQGGSGGTGGAMATLGGTSYVYRQGGGSVTLNLSGTYVKHVLINRTSSSALRVVNNDGVNPVASTFSSNAAGTMYLAGRDPNIQGASSRSINTFSFAAFGNGTGQSLSPTEETALFTIVQAYEARMGRAIP